MHTFNSIHNINLSISLSHLIPIRSLNNSKVGQPVAEFNLSWCSCEQSGLADHSCSISEVSFPAVVEARTVPWRPCCDPRS